MVARRTLWIFVVTTIALFMVVLDLDHDRDP
jgi:hypothetical protein